MLAYKQLGIFSLSLARSIHSIPTIVVRRRRRRRLRSKKVKEQMPQ